MTSSIWKWLRGRQPEREPGVAPGRGQSRVTWGVRLDRLALPGLHDVEIVQDREAGQ